MRNGGRVGWAIFFDDQMCIQIYLLKDVVSYIFQARIDIMLDYLTRYSKSSMKYFQRVYHFVYCFVNSGPSCFHSSVTQDHYQHFQASLGNAVFMVSSLTLHDRQLLYTPDWPIEILSMQLRKLLKQDWFHCILIQQEEKGRT